MRKPARDEIGRQNLRDPGAVKAKMQGKQGKSMVCELLSCRGSGCAGRPSFLRSHFLRDDLSGRVPCACGDPGTGAPLPGMVSSSCLSPLMGASTGFPQWGEWSLVVVVVREVSPWLQREGPGQRVLAPPCRRHRTRESGDEWFQGTAWSPG